ncbi:CapA family protein [Pseudarthrobacter sp. NamE2]|uniref:CapA family protein n=1 Tax=Pseudarthrobacter sp. NamE2 TaxID=2576838 RepID=UPI0010FCEE34|nr:CapA family protein [Pseudarthrobacter sp. NamE2]TLM86332.1 CapA family protein [Pseudarthrobacter sp. NamE2]
MGTVAGLSAWRLRVCALAMSLAGALTLPGVLAGCGLLAEQNGTSTPAAQSTTSATGTPAADPVTEPPATAAPTPTPGKGLGCPVLRCTTVLVTGDMLVHDELWHQAQQDAAAAGKPGLDFVPLLEGQRRYISNSDLAVCHQETPVAGPEGPFSTYPSFNVPPQIIAAAKEVGYQACTTASNHTIDRGTDGLLRTLDALDAAGLKHTGSYRTENESAGILILQTPAAKVALIQATYGLNGLVAEYPWQVDMLDAPAMIAKAERARAQGADIVLAAMHAGDEYSSAPNAQQLDVAHALADSGQFNLIYGHHTHSVLPIENYNGTWIVYGLGNGVTELSPTYTVNNEGLLVRAQFGQDESGKWSVTDLAWAPSVIVSNPYRWCSVASDAPQGPCEGAGADAETRQRTQSVVESMGAAAAGARELLITREP